MTTPPTSSVRGVNGAVATADQLATNAGIGVLAGGGNAVDAAIAANAVMGVVAPHLCGMGGDLFALVHRDGEVAALNASGRAGSGADADELRAAGLTEMPFRNDIHSVTVPGCVDGWIELHARFGSRPLDRPAGARDQTRRVWISGESAARRRRCVGSTTRRPCCGRRWQVPRPPERGWPAPGWRRRCGRSSPTAEPASTRVPSVKACSAWVAASTAPTTSPDPRRTGSHRCRRRRSESSCTRSHPTRRDT